MRTYICIIIVLISLACSSKKNQMEFQGGTFSMCLENEPMQTVSYEMVDYYSAAVYGQILEGLTSIDPQSLKIKPQIASEWEISDDGLVYTFTIREEVLFHPHELFKNDKERTLSIKDIIATFELVCKPTDKKGSTIAYGHLLKDILVGAEEYHLGKESTIKGLQNKKGKLEITLKQRDENFLYKLAQIQLAIHSEKIIKSNLMSKAIGTGPFFFHDQFIEEVPKIILARNEDYYEEDEQGNQLPYLDTLLFIVENKKLTQLEMFESKEIDVILALPTSKISQIVEDRYQDFQPYPNAPKLILNKNALLQTHYYFFNMDDERFKDMRVRQAFNYAINREKIGIDILKNQFDELGYYGVVPPIQSTFRGYNFGEIEKLAYKYDPKKAQRLLAEAGYPEGKGFGILNLRFNIGDVNSAVADEFAQQIANVLGITVNIDGSDFETLSKDYIAGNGQLFKTSWVADYPNPENFLENFHSTNIPHIEGGHTGYNYSKYNNPLFDQKLDLAKRETNLGKKMKLYAVAEVELMKNPPIIPLWYSGDMQIVHTYVRNLHFNSLSLFDFKKVYLKPLTIQEYQNEIAKK